MLPLMEIAKQMESTSAAIHQFGLVSEPRGFEPANGRNAHAFVAHQQIADAENEGAVWEVGNHLLVRLLAVWSFRMG